MLICSGFGLGERDVRKPIELGRKLSRKARQDGSKDDAEPEAEGVAEAPFGLPYDPEDWARRLEEARKRRAEALRDRPASDAGPPTLGVAQPERPPMVESAAPAAEPEIATTDRRWRTIALISGATALLCIGIAIGVVLTVFRLMPEEPAIANFRIGDRPERPQVEAVSAQREIIAPAPIGSAPIASTPGELDRKSVV